MRRKHWIEHYPRGAAIVDQAAFAVVTFNDRKQPSWNYTNQRQIAAQWSVHLNFLHIDPSDLNSIQSKGLNF